MPSPKRWCVKLEKSDTLEQGDILRQVPCPFPEYVPGTDYSKAGVKVDVPIVVADVVVMTHTCDVRKVSSILVCQLEPYEALKMKGQPLESSKAQIQVDQGTHPGFYLLHARSPDGTDFGELVVKFRQQTHVTKVWLQEFAKRQNPRLRLKRLHQVALLHRFGEFYGRPLIPDEDEPDEPTD
jgi:hypothetical protein